MSRTIRASLRSCASSLVAAAAFFAAANGASATSTFEYYGYQAVAGTSFSNVTITYTNTDPSTNTYGNGASVSEYGGMGEITLLASTHVATDNLNVFCMDIYHWLAGSGTSFVGTLGVGGSGYPNPALTNSQLTEIAYLVNGASAAILSGGSNASAAIQLAIWEIEYQTGPSNGTMVVSPLSNGPTFKPDNSGLLALAATYVTDAEGHQSGSYNVVLLTPDTPVQNQDLVYIAPCPPTGCPIIGQPTPLPGALPLMASGLGGLGLLGWRRKRKKTVALAA